MNTKYIQYKLTANKINDNISAELYYTTYLDPKKEWMVGTKDTCFYEISSMYDLLTSDGKQELYKRIKYMDYQDFLSTRYWKACTQEIRRRSKYKCKMCKGNHKLRVHHKNYENHGCEHLHLRDLQCLCESCHDKVHKKQIK